MLTIETRNRGTARRYGIDMKPVGVTGLALREDVLEFHWCVLREQVQLRVDEMK